MHQQKGIIGNNPNPAAALIDLLSTLFLLELCTYCKRVVIDQQGNRTEDYGKGKYGKYMCSKCLRAFEFSIGG
jgi:hypothetical protein